MSTNRVRRRTTPFLSTYEGVRVECAKFGDDYTIGQIVPIRGAAPADPAVPADAVTASGSGLDPHISIAYADLQVDRVAKTRGVSPDLIRQAVADHTDGRSLGIIGEPTRQRARAQPRTGPEVSGEGLT